MNQTSDYMKDKNFNHSRKKYPFYYYSSPFVKKYITQI